MTALVTRCPSCATAFRAGAEQLTARGGQVRCGRCGSVFDALLHVVPETAFVPTAAATGSAANETASATLAAANRAEPGKRLVHTDTASASPLTQVAIIQPPLPADAPPAAEAAVQRPPPDMPPAHDTLVLTPPPAEAIASESDATPEAADAAKPPPEVADANLELDFGRQSRTAPSIRLWISIPAASLLLLILAGQVAFHFRGDLALLFPQYRPWMEQICVQLECNLPLPKRADMMSIESSDLQADPLNPGVMVLSATVRNRAPFAQAPPALELTLTDARDQALARRVLAAADYVPPGASGEPERAVAARRLFPAGAELNIKLSFDASAVNATGYRLYLFYP